MKPLDSNYNLFLGDTLRASPGPGTRYNITSFFNTFKKKNDDEIYEASLWKFQTTKPKDLDLFLKQLTYYPRTVAFCIEFLEDLIKKDDDEHAPSPQVPIRRHDDVSALAIEMLIGKIGEVLNLN